MKRKRKLKSVEEILSILEPMVEYYSTRINDKIFDREDIQQELRFRIFKAYQNFNFQFKPKTYFVKVVLNEVKNVRMKIRKRLEIENQAERLQNCFSETKVEIDTHDLDRELLTKYVFSEIERKAKTELVDMIKLLFVKKMDGYKYREISVMTNTSTGHLSYYYEKMITQIATRFLV